MAAPLKIVFLGSDPIALPLLDWTTGEGAAHVEIAAVFTQPDRPVGRGQKVQPNAIKSWALARDLPVLQPEKLTDEVRRQFANLQPDLALVMAYGHILREEFIEVPWLGTLNLHVSLLPRYRGASPIQTAIACGDAETAVSLMRIVRRLDAGPVADIERVAIEPLDTALEVEAKLAAACVPLLQRALPLLRTGKLEFAEQDESAATYCRRLTKEDGVLDFAASANELAARINGLFPWPSCRIELDGELVKLGLAEALPGEGAAGEVVGVDEHGLLVGTAAGRLRLRRLQRSGGRMLEAAEFLRGFPIAPGTRITSTPMPPLVGNAPFKVARRT